MSDDNLTPDPDMASDVGDADDLASLVVDPDELPEGEEIDPEAVIDDDAEDDHVGDHVGDTEPLDHVAVPSAGAGRVEDEVKTDEERLNLDDGDETEEKKRPPREDQDENEMSSSDDEEADLATILAEKLRSSDGLSPDDDPVVVDVDDATDGTPLLQPRRPDEEHCQQCFLLVRKSAPKCPVDHDLCPLFPGA